ncbi:phytanoyl-CoA dioxygenase family protein [Pseudozobellia thermophila]|uniref:Ectoine hydroxylase-related dioxygenase, phytanoyl-CoA dioxygenase (PhyH) family n=1 Tax=Pseudozobellia thermophila TaxID=192903 RepID=A0A1M6BG77_9FLAO|nr:phytanoyl-CoA dioxygenase family protein [Pseudozobellia thermophila]SHI47744.1 Ectoine hydroxylase-related dioxygenase, phytanoyl-CoA dioxygenase (PhyH) family [Pseudozobellia thermophila]
MYPLDHRQKTFFEEEGYLVIEDLLSPAEVAYYSDVYTSFLENRVDASRYRSDLSGSKGKSEKITQIMVPSKVLPQLLEKPLHQKSLGIAKALMGDDIALDFDMLINKAPFTNTITPWHQDAAYWIDMPDKRAASCWVAIDPAFKENGCMWYTPKSHSQPLLPHVQTGNKGALKCEGSEANSVCVELRPGSCVFHQGGTLHYSRGNSTAQHRRALITNFRPAAMIALERQKGVDHTGEREIKAQQMPKN